MVAEYYRNVRESVSLLKAHGHRFANRYSLAKLANERDILDRIRRRDLAVKVIADQHVGSAVFSGSKKGIRALEKLIQQLEG